MSEAVSPKVEPEPGLGALPTDAELDALKQLAERIARKAGELIFQHRPAHVEVAATKSSGVDVVTEMDTASEELIRTMILAERPNDSILGEEGGHVDGVSGLTWIVDPIDGTVNYLYDIPAYAVSIAVVRGEPSPEEWTVLAGCVHAPAQDRTWSARRGGGAHLNGHQVFANRVESLALSLVGTGFGYLEQRRAEQGAIVATLLPKVRDIRRIGSAALDLCALASGGLDLFYERGLNPWDIAAGMLMVQEAGGIVTGLDGKPASIEMLVAGAGMGIDLLAAELSILNADCGA